MTLRSDVAGGHREALVALRDGLASAFDEANTNEKAALGRQLQAVLKELAALPNTEESSAVDDLAHRRAERRAKTPPAGRTGTRVKRGSGGG